MKRLLFILFSLSINLLSFSQQINPDDVFISDNVCKGENIVVENNSRIQAEYEWDFCANVLQGDSLSFEENLIDVPDNLYLGSNYFEHNDTTYGLYTGYNDNQLITITFDSTLNPISSTSNTIITGIKTSLETVYENGRWYGITHSTDRRQLQLLDFGQNLENLSNPTGRILRGNIGDGGVLSGMDIMKYQDSTFVFITNFANGLLNIINLGETIDDDEISSVKEYNISSFISGTYHAEVFQHQGKLFLAAMNLSQKLVILEFGNSFNNDPSLKYDVNLQPFTQGLQTRSFEIVEEFGELYALITTNTTVHRVKFVNDFSTDGELQTEHTRLLNFSTAGTLFNLSAVKKNGNWNLFMIDTEKDQLNNLKINGDCNPTKYTSSLAQDSIVYSNFDQQYISLKVTDTNGLTSYVNDTVSFSSDSISNIGLMQEGNCLDTPISLSTNSNKEIISWYWTFDENNNSTSANPNYQFPKTDTFLVTLTTIDETNCKSTNTFDVPIYNIPEVSFLLPDAPCLNQETNLQNTTSTLGDNIISWEWKKDGEVFSVEQNPLIQFTELGNFDIQLKASIDGCADSLQQNIEINLEGAIVDFEFNNTCFGDTNKFQNTSVDEEIIDYSWNFGDETTSSLENPIHKYNLTGTYTVSLEATTSNGCISSKVQEVQVYNLPIADFTNSASCSEQSTVFTNTSTSIDGEITQYLWDIEDQNYNTTNVLYTFENISSNNVLLKIESEFGCTDSIQKTINTLQSPIADFNFRDVCISNGFPTNSNLFDNQSIAADSITQYYWLIGDDTLKGNNPSFTENIIIDENYDITLVIEDRNNCTDTINKETVYQSCYSDIFISETVCRGENIVVQSNSYEGINYEWDFCANVLGGDSSSFQENLTDVPDNLYLGSNYFEHNGTTYGLYTGYNEDQLITITFDSTLNPISSTSNTIITGIKTSLETIYENDRWYGITHSTDRKQLQLLDFGQNLENLSNPTSRILRGNTGDGGAVSSMDIIKYKDSTFVLITNFANGLLNIINLGETIDDDEIPSVREYNISSFISGTYHAEVFQHQGKLFLAAMNLSQKIVILEFGTSFRNTPILKYDIDLQPFTQGLQTRSFEIIEEFGQIYTLITTNTTVERVKFANDFSTDSELQIEHTRLLNFPTAGTLFNLSALKKDGNWNLFMIDTEASQLNNLKINGNCTPTKFTSSLTQDSILYSTFDQQQYISLKATDANGLISYINDTVSFSSDSITNINLIQEGNCVDALTSLSTDSKKEITSWYWTFDENNNSNSENPSYQFPEADTFSITLTTIDEANCKSTNIFDVPIYNTPQIEFSLPNTPCLNQEVNLQNTSSLLDSNIVSWEWKQDGEVFSSEQNPLIQFSELGSFDIQLKASIDGCADSLQQNIEINLEGAVVDFVFNNECLGDTNRFQNTSVGEEIIDYSWNFGDETISSLENPIHKYETPDSYTISLEVTTSNGCISSKIQEVQIYNLPVADFTNAISCSEQLTNFTNTSTSIDGEVTQYTWIIEDQSYNTPNPQYIFENLSSNNILLKVESEFGCVDSTQKTINTLKSPVADFNFKDVCVSNGFPNTPNLFNDQSTATDSIIQYSWLVNDDTLKGNNPSFLESIFIGENYDVTLITEDRNGCIDTTSKNIVYLSCYSDVFISNIVCKGENVIVQANPYENITYEWDFCANTIENKNPLLEENLINLPENIYLGTSYFEHNDTTYGLYTGYNEDQLITITFDSILNPISSTSSTIITGIKTSLETVYENDSWYGITHSTDRRQLQLLDFGQDLENLSNPTGRILRGSIGDGGPVSGMDIIKYQDSTFVFISNFTNNILNVVNLGETIDDDSISSVIEYNVSPFISSIYHAEVFQHQGKLFFAGMNLSQKLVILEFGTSFRNAPTLKYDIDLQPFTFGSQTRSFEIVEEFGQLYALVTTNTTVHRIKFVNDFSTNSELETEHTRLLDFTTADKLFNLSAIKRNGDWNLLMIDTEENQLNKLKINGNCNPNQYKSVFELDSVAYSDFDQQYISLKATDANGLTTYVNEIVSFSSDSVPNINMPLYYCTDVPVDIIPNADKEITSWYWNIDKLNETYTTEIASTTLPGLDTFAISLTTFDIDGCKNTISTNISSYEAPIANFTFPNLTCTNQQLSLSNSSENNIEGVVEWNWLVNDTIFSTAEDTIISYTDNGTFDIKLIASIIGCSDTTTKNLNIIPGPKTDFNVSDVCLNEDHEFENTTTGENIISYAWDFGDTNTDIEENTTHQYDTSGTYTVTLTAENELGCITPMSKEVITHQLPEAQFENGLSCSQGITEFYNRSISLDGDIINYEWTINNLDYIEADPAHIFDEGGDFNTKLKITTEFGCLDSLSQLITVAAAPIANFLFNENCLNDVSIFTDASTDFVHGIMEKEWSIDGEIVNNINNPSYTFEEAGTYPILLEVTAGSGCKDTTLKQITIDPLPIIDFTYSPVCLGDTTIFIDNTSSPTDTIVRYEWNFFGLGLQYNDTAKVVYNNTNEQSTRLVVTTAKGCQQTLTKTIDVNKKPIALFDVNETFGAPPFELTTNNQSSEAQNFYWSFEDVNSTETSPTHTFDELGNYVVKLVAENELGCTDTFSRVIEVVDLSLDIVLHSVDVLEKNGEWTIILDVENRSSFTLKDAVIQIDLGGEFVIYEVLKELAPLERDNYYPLNFTLDANDAKGLDFVCTELQTNVESLEENNLLDNEKCINLEETDLKINSIYPNPTQGTFSVEYFVPRTGVVQLSLYNVLGENIFYSEIEKAEGAHQNIIDISTLADGIYFLTMRYSGKEVTRKITKQ
ncbi:MAG: PKD domain-containing protein [Cytophagales bacterium]|nr:PKD domain-containing protein [Cytophagales bacterium]